MQSRLVSFHKAKHANPMEHSQLFPNNGDKFKHNKKSRFIAMKTTLDY